MIKLLIFVVFGLSSYWITPAVAQQEVTFVRTGEITAWYKKYMGFALARGVVDSGCFLGECQKFGILFTSVDEYYANRNQCIIRYAGGLMSEYVGGITRPTLYNGEDKVTGNPDYITFPCIRKRG